MTPPVQSEPADRTVFRTCPLCEATCGLEITIRDGQVKRIRGDQDDVFSHGFICPKGSTLKQLHEDPDRLRRPLVRSGFDAGGAPVFEEVSWDEAFAAIESGLSRVREESGNEATAIYLGNPNAHLFANMVYTRPLLMALGTRNVFSASTVDQMPRHVASGYLYGDPMAVPVPDLDRTDYLVMLGANPYASNGSVCTAPDFPGRIEAIQERGGKVVVVDPRTSRTAEQADVHLAIRPGTDSALLAAVARLILHEHRDAVGAVGEHVQGLDELAGCLDAFSVEQVAAWTGIEAEAITALAHEIASASSAAVYGRIGTHTVEFGTLAAWLVDVVNLVSGNLDRPGGAMFNRPAGSRQQGDKAGGRGYKVGRWTSRVNSRPEVQGEIPSADLPDEILVPGDGQIRALFTIAGNPALSCPDSNRMTEALADLDFMVSVDIYLNETSRHADVILPPPSALEKSHYDLPLYQFAIRNVANWSPAVFESEGPTESDILARLALVAGGFGVEADPELVHDQVIRTVLEREVSNQHSPVFGRDTGELLDQLTGPTPADRVLDAMLRTGPYGEGFGADPDGLSLAKLQESPHGIDFGPLEPRLPGNLRTESGLIELLPDPIRSELARLAGAITQPAPDLVLVGRRHLRSNNSWMHNVKVLVKGKPRCTLQVHPDDAARLDLSDGGSALVRSKVGEVAAPVEVTEAVRPGVVSLPHGWGHDQPGIQMQVARDHAGVNSNVLTDPSLVDPLSGNAVLNAIPVEVIPQAEVADS